MKISLRKRHNPVRAELDGLDYLLDYREDYQYRYDKADNGYRSSYTQRHFYAVCVFRRGSDNKTAPSFRIRNRSIGDIFIHAVKRNLRKAFFAFYGIAYAVRYALIRAVRLRKRLVVYTLCQLGFIGIRNYRTRLVYRHGIACFAYFRLTYNG